MTGRRHSSSSRPIRPSSPLRPSHSVKSVKAAAITSVAVLAAGAAVLAGCGSLSGAARTADPIVVMTMAPEGTKATNMPGMPAMAQAYARWINSRGGLGGRELRVIRCNDRNESVNAGRCARRAVAENVVAVVGSYSQHGRSFMPQLEASGIPYIGGYGIADEEFNSPLSYPVNGGVATLLAGNGRQLAKSCDQVSLVRPDTIAGDQMPSLMNAGLEQAHRKAAHDVRAPEDATDYTPQAERALSRAGADPALLGTAEYTATSGGACVTAALGDRTDSFFDSFRRIQGDKEKVTIASVLGSVQQSLVTRTGGKSSPLEGAYVTGWYPAASDPRWAPMRKVINEHAFGDNRIDPADPGVQTTWIAYTVLRSAIESLDGGEVTARSVRRALDGGLGTGGVDTGGLTPKLSWRYEDMLAVRGFPRITNARVTYQVVRDGRLVPVGSGSVDVARTLEERAEVGEYGG
ncbi:ABC transporter substrate-binding protein [Streptomyces sp. NPDC051776]|uniref:ABC transporter substrate-binding protein n=1 Tax=Streptomyces sp. NPDC051776 TaxID=3155414 RepID=UPI00341223A7